MEKIREMQLLIVEMIKDIDMLLKKNNIKYTLLGGSVLGAVRHQGFIPWDDDMDIGIMRKDYARAERILTNLDKYVYESAEKHIIPDAPTGHLHLVNEYYPIENSPTIDIFALDGVPKSKNNRKIFRILANIHHLSVLRIPPKNRGVFAKKIIMITLLLIPKKLMDFIQKISLKCIIKIGEKNNECTGNIWGFWAEKEYFETRIYTDLINLKFEKLQLPVPKEYDAYLTQLYGNYMELPPVEKRVPKHKKF